jgi:hypothetical protein
MTNESVASLLGAYRGVYKVDVTNGTSIWFAGRVSEGVTMLSDLGVVRLSMDLSQIPAEDKILYYPPCARDAEPSDGIVRLTFEDDEDCRYALLDGTRIVRVESRGAFGFEP